MGFFGNFSLALEESRILSLTGPDVALAQIGLEKKKKGKNNFGAFGEKCRKLIIPKLQNSVFAFSRPILCLSYPPPFDLDLLYDRGIFFHRFLFISCPRVLSYLPHHFSGRSRAAKSLSLSDWCPRKQGKTRRSGKKLQS